MTRLLPDYRLSYPHVPDSRPIHQRGADERSNDSRIRGRDDGGCLRFACDRRANQRGREQQPEQFRNGHPKTLRRQRALCSSIFRAIDSLPWSGPRRARFWRRAAGETEPAEKQKMQNAFPWLGNRAGCDPSIYDRRLRSVAVFEGRTWRKTCR